MHGSAFPAPGAIADARDPALTRPAAKPPLIIDA